MLAISLVAAVMLMSASVQAQDMLQHRHSFFSSLPVEPTDENFKVSPHQVQVIGLDGFREWEVKGSLDSILSPNVIPSKGSGSVHIQWFDSKAPLLRPPFTPTFVPGFHMAVASEEFENTWHNLCPVLDELVGGVDCKGSEEALESVSRTTVQAKDFVALYHHHYLHKTTVPAGFLSSKSTLASLISKQSGSSSGPALIDLVLQISTTSPQSIQFKLKAIWPVGSAGKDKDQNSVTVKFDESTDSVAEVGWFYREVTENENMQNDHFLGATVRLDAKGEEVNEALILARSPVFPPHKRDFSTGNIKSFGHGFSSTMSPPQTFHPHSITTIRSNPYIQKTTAGCDLHVLQVLPAGIFVDPFQLESLAPEIGESAVFGETDLEKPVGVVPGWGSLVLVKVHPEESAKTSRWIQSSEENATTNEKTATYTSTVDIPMHMRYQPPVAKENAATHAQVAVPWPIVAWTCPRPVSDESAAKKLFQISPLPLGLLFRKSSSEPDQETVDFRFLLPDPIPKTYPEASVFVPVGRLEDLEVVRTTTFVMAAVGTLSVAWALVKAMRGRRASKGKQD
ncbi:protease B nonderepressible form [Podila epicladia]|nr:protease B nonderepressible form [Podila epicladia]KAG0087663.1 protease B nonderepressible form [Podila epicladia]